ncbi:hypothetical protein [Idiomarina loihiensis]
MKKYLLSVLAITSVSASAAINVKVNNNSDYEMELLSYDTHSF